MAKKFHVVNRETGERWVPTRRYGIKQYLVMYDSGYVAIVTHDGYYTDINPLDLHEWEVVHHEKKKATEALQA